MKKRNWKKIALVSSAIFLGLVVILGVHIWWVTHPRIDANTRVMARIDMHKHITQDDASKIMAWLYQQKGVEHVLVNPGGEIAIFSVAPAKNDVNRIVEDFRTKTGYTSAVRFVPHFDPNAAGCPVATTSLTYKVYKFVQRML